MHQQHVAKQTHTHGGKGVRMLGQVENLGDGGGVMQLIVIIICLMEINHHYQKGPLLFGDFKIRSANWRLELKYVEI